MLKYNLSNLICFLFFSSLIIIEFDLPRVGEFRTSYIPILVTIPIIMLIMRKDILLIKKIIFSPVFYSYAIFLIYGIISATWSINKLSGFIHSSILLSLLLLSVQMSYFNYNTMLRSIFVISSILIIFSWLYFLAFPELSTRYIGFWRLKAFFFHEFELGFLTCINLIICFNKILNYQIYKLSKFNIYYIMLFISLITLFATQTRTLLIYTLFIFFIMLIMAQGTIKKYLYLFVTAIFVLSVFSQFDLIIETFSRGSGDATLSGRLLTWERSLFVVEYFDRHLIGLGFDSFVSPIFDDFIQGRGGSYRASHAHNSFVMAYFETGLIGLSFLCIFIICTFRNIYLLSKISKEYNIVLYLFLLSFLGSFTSLIYAGKAGLLLFLPVCLYFSVINHIKSEVSN